MPLYLMLNRLTEQGARDIKQSPARIEAFKRAASDAGGDVKSVHAALGRYDTVATVAAPDDEAMARIALALCALGNVHTETLRLFSEEEYRKIVGATK